MRHLADELKARGLCASHQLVSELLAGEGCSLPLGPELVAEGQANLQTREGGTHADSDAQFEHINERIRAALAEGRPAISVDTKKKELVGDFKNRGREWHPKGRPEAVRVHDFIIPELGRADPYGVYDLAHNRGWVRVGTDHDTAAFAVRASALLLHQPELARQAAREPRSHRATHRGDEPSQGTASPCGTRSREMPRRAPKSAMRKWQSCASNSRPFTASGTRSLRPKETA